MNPFKGLFRGERGPSFMDELRSSTHKEKLEAIGGSDRYQVLMATMDLLTDETGKVSSQWKPEVSRELVAAADVSDDERKKLYAKIEELEGREKR